MSMPKVDTYFNGLLTKDSSPRSKPAAKLQTSLPSINPGTHLNFASYGWKSLELNRLRRSIEF
jgi:hypothetical protein